MYVDSENGKVLVCPESDYDHKAAEYRMEFTYDNGTEIEPAILVMSRFSAYALLARDAAGLMVEGIEFEFDGESLTWRDPLGTHTYSVRSN